MERGQSRYRPRGDIVKFFLFPATDLSEVRVFEGLAEHNCCRWVENDRRGANMEK